MLLTALFGSAGFFSVAAAQGVTTGTSINVNGKVEVKGNSTSTEAQAAVRGNATSTVARTETRRNATSTDAGTHATTTAEMHRSSVASFVQSLLDVAEREGGIGAEVRAVAMAQQHSASTSADAITKVEAKGNLRTFFFGSDYKNLAKLRAEMEATEKNIAELKVLLAEATTDEDKAELSAQIKVLEDTEAKINAFIELHEDKFSLFGWFAKWFY